MPPDKTKLPKHVIDIWPDVFKDIDLKVVPLDYLHSIRVVFQDGKIWDIDIQNSKDEDGRHCRKSQLRKIHSGGRPPSRVNEQKAKSDPTPKYHQQETPTVRLERPRISQQRTCRCLLVQ